MHIVLRLIAAAGALAAAQMVLPAHAADERSVIDASYTPAMRGVEAPEIIGGRIAPAGRWPFQVGLLTANVSDNFQAQFCGGTLVHSLIVVTAAHCMEGMTAAKLHILTGTQDLANGGTRRQVAAIRKHPNYNPNTEDYDIAVVKLKTPATGLALARLLLASQETTLAKTGTPAYVTGWGNLSTTGSNYPTKLYEVQVPLVSRTVCNAAIALNGDVTLRMICAGPKAGGRDSCQGDSGGPLVVKDSTSKFRVLAGVVSWGEGCGQPNKYGVYSRVAILSAWVKSTMTALGVGADAADLVASLN